MPNRFRPEVGVDTSYENDPEFIDFINRANRELKPILKDSDMSITLWDDRIDAKLGVELDWPF